MVTIEQELAPARRRRIYFRFWMALLGILALFSLLFWYEAKTSRFQAHFATRLVRQMWFRLEPGPTDSVVYPTAGPFDLRRGYVRLPAIEDTLLNQHFEVAEQARFSPSMLKVARLGIYPPYKEKTQAGLCVLDAQDRVLYSATYPERVYTNFDSIPDVVVQTLLYIENRELLDDSSPLKNPAVEWDRLAKASIDLVGHLVFHRHDMPGGSTLATQIEKYRHTEEGRTSSPKEKLKQMASATLRSYLDGENTVSVRRDIVLNFVNSVPLAAIAGYGEVNGLGDGLWAWYDADFNRMNDVLRSIPTLPETIVRGAHHDAVAEAAGMEMPPHETDVHSRYRLEDQARAFKMMVSLFIAHRRPSTYLLGNREMLRADTDAYLRLLARDGLISPEFRDVALKLDLDFRKRPPVPLSRDYSFVERKAANAIRTRLLSLMNIDQLYDLDRVDLTARSTLDRDTQKSVTRLLQNLRDPVFADSAGLNGFRLLEKGDPSGVIYSFTLYESTPRGNLLRVQADNYDQPLDINEGAKLDLGSTAKLRTLVNYLMIISELHHKYAGQSRRELDRIPIDPADHIRQWAIDFLATSPDTSLWAMLDGAMMRPYSASPGETFFTGGGVHHFVNFDPKNNGMVMTVRDGTHNSVNLVYIRLMRDIEHYYMADLPDYSPDLFDDPAHPLRQKYLARFADKEGRDFLAKFWNKYRGKTPGDALELLVSQIKPTVPRLAVIFRSVYPDAPLPDFRSFVLRHMQGVVPSDRMIESAYETYPITAFNLQDRGYIAHVHPLDLWLVASLTKKPDLKWSDIVANSQNERQEVYGWLFKTRYKESQNTRIRILLEIEAFEKIHEAWAKQGYPFSSLVPSYATSIGSSADRPAALAELMGIIQNNGVRYPSARIETLHFARGTPYETIFAREPVKGERVLPPEVAQMVRQTIIGVVEKGTAVRAFKIFPRDDGTWVPVGGKTGTGDQRYETFGRGGRLIESRVVNRTGTFVFLIGDHYFGTVVAYVAGPKAAQYGFTSSLPVQILKILSPVLGPLVMRDDETASRVAVPPNASTVGTEADSTPPAGVSPSGE